MLKTNFSLSVDVTIITDRLLKTVPGDVVTWDELYTLLGSKNLRATSVVYKARREVLRNNRMVFDAIRRVGIKRLNDEETIDKNLEPTRKSDLKRYGRRMMELATVNFDQLSLDYQARHNTAMTLTSTKRAISTKNVVDRLMAEITISQQQLPIAKTLEFFRSVHANSK